MNDATHPYAEHYRILDGLFAELLGETSIALPDSVAEEIREFLEHNEFGVAFDLLVDVIKSEQLRIPPPVLEKIARIGMRMNLNPEQWEDIRTA